MTDRPRETYRQFCARMRRNGWTQHGSAADGVLFVNDATGARFYPLNYDVANGCCDWQLHADKPLPSGEVCK